MALINLIPLGIGGHANLITNGFGLSMLAYARVHRWISRLAVMHSALHVVASLVLSKGRLGRMTRQQVAGLIVCTT
jgi:hypothetical protein